MSDKQTVQSVLLGNLRESSLFELVVIDHGHLPSWERPGQSKNGFADLRAHGNKTKGWLSIDVREVGDRSERTACITLQPAAGRALLAYLKAIYEVTS
jgi:hypothetical protein